MDIVRRPLAACHQSAVASGKSEDIDVHVALEKVTCTFRKEAEVSGKPVWIPFVVLPPCDAYGVFVSFAPDVSVIAITCENNEDGRRISGLAAIFPDVCHRRVRPVSPLFLDQMAAARVAFIVMHGVEAEVDRKDPVVEEWHRPAELSTMLLNGCESGL